MTSNDIEAALKSCNSMADIHKEAVSNTLLKSAVADSLAPVISLKTVKENKVEMGDIATDDDIECLWSFVDMIDSSLSMSNTTKKDIYKSSKFLEFVDSHCRALCLSS